ncbi:MAG: DNA methyltransferase [Clostridia bacterium]|nr:DNA methyltransferase [Clostridia bacterium]
MTKRLVDVFREVKRVMKPDGTLWIVISDSYAGSGTTALVAQQNGRDYILIDINTDYIELTRRRISAGDGDNVC